MWEFEKALGVALVASGRGQNAGKALLEDMVRSALIISQGDQGSPVGKAGAK